MKKLGSRVLAAFVVAIVMAVAGQAQIPPTGVEPVPPQVLRLKITNCAGDSLPGTVVEMRHRHGDHVDRYAGVAGADAKITFYFAEIAAGDWALVTLLPAGGAPDSSHRYRYRGPSCDNCAGPGAWDLGQSDPTPPGGCRDSWLDEELATIQCKYNPPAMTPK
jgi:hypothetical protein